MLAARAVPRRHRAAHAGHAVSVQLSSAAAVQCQHPPQPHPSATSTHTTTWTQQAGLSPAPSCLHSPPASRLTKPDPFLADSPPCLTIRSASVLIPCFLRRYRRPACHPCLYAAASLPHCRRWRRAPLLLACRACPGCERETAPLSRYMHVKLRARPPAVFHDTAPVAHDWLLPPRN